MTRYVWWVRGDEFAELASLSAASVLAMDPEAMTDIRVDDGTRPRMVANLDVQITALTQAPVGTRILFMDADTIMRKPFPWGDECVPQADLYATWRDHVAVKDGEKVEGIASLMPYNYGVLGVVSNPRTWEAFYWLRARILKMAPQYQDWYGNQLALADLLAAPAPVKTVRIRWALDDKGTALSVRCLPCDTWNYSPESPDEDVSDKGILHFKGGRKDLMDHYRRAA